MYVAIILMESAAERPGRRPLYREDVALIHAPDEATARLRAEERGRGAEAAFLNERGEMICWRLRAVVDVAAVLDEDLSHDADLYARHFRDLDAYERFEPLLRGEEL
ncbi:DUF4288 domain-containing protein [Streptomyces varsoviensis]|uniref:DUF4288 domain-containing protein n=1 Tax=Streptomyces varsoviensis TaxID=67373 RepID=A0ABR5IYR9_9ACTN|nr:DUF4288 domain-containing protein [Streptomyces varsoviensis]KOG86242.1 hypothetical protein ADK38_32145 [Streptomyces varsoviensis]